MDKLVLVDKDDNVLGSEEKVKCHLGDGILHRAFSVFVFDKENRLLLQQRSKEKMLWPLFWSNTCCSHPRLGEDAEDAVKKRLEEELGFSCSVKYIGVFSYYARYNDLGSENELCYVFFGEYDGDVEANLKEVNDWKWIDFKELLKDVKESPEKYTPWFKIELRKFKDDFEKYKNTVK